MFGNRMSDRDKRSLATLIYYPKEKMELIKKTEENMEDWYKITLYRLIEVCKRVASKYTRSKFVKPCRLICICYRGAYHRETGAQ